jgi:adenosylhomocysteine nucleosidase
MRNRPALLLGVLELLLVGCLSREAVMPSAAPSSKVVVLISAEAEWRPVKAHLRPPSVQATPFGESFRATLTPGGPELTFLHGGYGQLAAAASTQYAVEHFAPALLVNLGTCGGFEGSAAVGDVVLASETVVYDIEERMGDSVEAIADFSSALPVLWPARLRGRVRVERLLSADRDLDARAVPALRRRFGGVGGDWESGAIAFVARRNRVPLLVLREVSDVVTAGGSPTYGDLPAWQTMAAVQLVELLGLLGEALPEVLAAPLEPPRTLEPARVLSPR